MLNRAIRLPNIAGHPYLFRLLGTALLLFLALIILLVSLIQSTNPVFSHNLSEGSSFAQASPTPMPGLEGTPTPYQVDYYLPYPGLLPDSPLWPLKALRDRLWPLITLNPTTKAEKFLHLADKRTAAAEVLIQGNQPDLGTSVATKAGKYLEKALIQEQKARDQGQNTDTLLENIAKSALKQQEIIHQSQTKVEGEAASALGQANDYAAQAYLTAAQRLRDRHRPVPGQN